MAELKKVLDYPAESIAHILQRGFYTVETEAERDSLSSDIKTTMRTVYVRSTGRIYHWEDDKWNQDKNGSIDLDTEMSDSSDNGVENRVIKAYVDSKVGENVDLSNVAKLAEENTFTGKQNFNGEQEINGVTEINKEVNVNNTTVNFVDSASDTVTKHSATGITIGENKIEYPTKKGTFGLKEDTIYLITGTSQNPVNFAKDLEIGTWYLLTGAYRNNSENTSITLNEKVLCRKMSNTQVILIKDYLTYYIEFDSETGYIAKNLKGIANIILNEENYEDTPKKVPIVYAPSTSGETGQVLQSNGSNKEPTWGSQTIPLITGTTNNPINLATGVKDGYSLIKGNYINDPSSTQYKTSEYETLVYKMTLNDDGCLIYMFNDATSVVGINLLTVSSTGKITKNTVISAIGKVNGLDQTLPEPTDIYAPTKSGMKGQILKSTGTGEPEWETLDETPTKDSVKVATSGGTYSALAKLSQSYETVTDDNAVVIRNGNIVKQMVTFVVTGNSEKVWSFPYSYDSDKKPMCWCNSVAEGSTYSNGASVIEWSNTQMTVRNCGADSSITFYAEGWITK